MSASVRAMLPTPASMCGSLMYVYLSPPVTCNLSVLSNLTAEENTEGNCAAKVPACELHEIEKPDEYNDDHT